MGPVGCRARQHRKHIRVVFLSDQRPDRRGDECGVPSEFASICLVGREIPVSLVKKKMRPDSKNLAGIDRFHFANRRKFFPPHCLSRKRLLVIRRGQSGVSKASFPIGNDEFVHFSAQLHCHPVYRASTVILIVRVCNDDQSLARRCRGSCFRREQRAEQNEDDSRIAATSRIHDDYTHTSEARKRFNECR